MRVGASAGGAERTDSAVDERRAEQVLEQRAVVELHRAHGVRQRHAAPRPEAASQQESKQFV